MPEVPAHLRASELLRETKPCQFCAATIRKGYTVKGKVSWFDADGTNHWATCPGRAEARRHFGPRKSR